MGIGNTTPSSAIIAVFSGMDPDEVTGRGTGINDAGWEKKVAVIRQGIDVNQPDPSDPLDVLAKVGGFEIGGLAGLVLGAAARGIPVVCDGLISTAGALIACELAPTAKQYLFAGHRSVEVGHRFMHQRLGLEPLLDYVSDLELRSICAQCLRRFAAWTEPRLADCRTQVIFNDLNASNVLVDPDEPDRVVGIIDFGDIVKSPLVIDIAVAAAYLCRGGTSPLDDVFDFLAAYHAESQILANEFALLPELMRMRNVLTIVIASWRAARYPDNSEYILRSVEHARLMLDTLAARDNAELARTFKDYCNGHKDLGKS
jgi:hypothetical protein